MSRAKKILIVTFVLAIGISLALPFRRQPGESTQPLPAVDPLLMSSRNGKAMDTGQTVRSSAPLDRGRSKQVEAHMASTRDDQPTTSPATGFDLEGHPALANRPTDDRKDRLAVRPDHSLTAQPRTRDNESPVTPQTLPGLGNARPAYATSLPSQSDAAAWPEELIHVVHNGDTLEKLAERYLGDPGRALELFDLNREQLSNPHLLPIGAELRIPVPARREND